MLWDEIAEQKIRDAQAEGTFDHLPGFGQPIAGMDDFDNPLAWLRDKMRREQKTELLVTAHSQALHRTVIAVIDAANEIGVQKIRMSSHKKTD